jgi:hypothetical protein
MVGSDALAEAADGYGGVLHGDPAAATDHCALWGPEVRAIDRGWPSDDVQEFLAGARDATSALATWLGDLAARATLLDPTYGAIGVARVADLLVAVVSRPCGRLIASLHRGRARRRLRARRLGHGVFELRGRVLRTATWRLVVRFDGTSGWRDASVPVRALRFTARRARPHA